MNLTNSFQYSEELARRSKRRAMRARRSWACFNGKFDVHEKSKNNPVTTADLEANRIIRERVLKTFPADGWLSEEDQDNPERLALSRVWVVDPIDGTKEFIEGVPQFAVSIAFVVDGRPQVAMVYQSGEGAFLQSRGGPRCFLERPDHSRQLAP